jgi:hypothetical protein
MKIRAILAPIVVVGLVTALVAWAVQEPPDPLGLPREIAHQHDHAAAVEQLNGFVRQEWPADFAGPETASELEILRRLSLALHGTIPSLEEIRRFEVELQRQPEDADVDVVTRWTERMLRDRRFADYFAERLARGFVGTDGGAFVVYRRDRFVDWLSDELAGNRPYDELVREIIADKGLWTGQPAVNFVTAAVAEGEIDYDKLTGKTVRMFLGQRIDCAQCHDHPFDDWKQTDYQGLAAFYGELNLTLVGVEDKPGLTYAAENRMTLERETIEPRVPFHPEWLPETGTRRERLASWVTHPENRRFSRAIASRVWTLLVGVPFYPQLAVDDLPDPPAEPDLLDFLGDDFRAHGYDLRRLILRITSSDAFRMSSVAAAETEQEYDLLKNEHRVFPLTRLRPEQLIGAMLQAASVKTIDQNSHLFARATRFFREIDFVRDYGDLGPDELDARAGTVTQALLRMNGNLTREIVTASPLSSSLRIARMSTDDGQCIENCFLICLTRRPTPDEEAHFLRQLEGTRDETRSRVVEDLFWSLFNSEEFSWNH